MHHHMEHFRDSQLFRDETLIAGGVEGQLACRERSSNRLQWFGFFVVDQSVQIESGVRMRLVFHDGRTADIAAEEIRGCPIPGTTNHAIDFFVMGDLHYPGHRRDGRNGSRRLSG